MTITTNGAVTGVIQADQAAWLASSVSGAGKVSTALAMLIPSSGSVAANGALTLTTAIPLAGGYSWGCYMYLPAGAAYAASVAGLYYVEMSANNAGTIYNNRYTSGSPTIPTTKTPIVAAGPGAYTQTTSPVDLITVTLPANTLGANGRVLHQPAWVFPNNANNKVISTTFGGSNVYAKTRTAATQETPIIDIRNRGVTNRQFSAWSNTGGPVANSTAGVTNTAIDTTADVNIITRGQLAVATDYIILESCSVEYVPF